MVSLETLLMNESMNGWVKLCDSWIGWYNEVCVGTAMNEWMDMKFPYKTRLGHSL